MRRPRPRFAQRPAAAPAGALRTLVIDAVGGQGDGWAASSRTHVSFTLPGETVEAKVAEGRGDLVAVLEPSPRRVAPPCPHFGRCGGCALQHWDHDAYLAWKVEQVRAALEREGIETAILPPYAAPPGARRRLTLHARKGAGGEVRLGFKSRRSWALAPVEVCPISAPRLVAAFPALACLAAPLFEHPASAPSLHVTLTETGIDVDVTGVEARSGGLSADARRRVADLALAADFARVTLAGEALYLSRMPMVRFGPAMVGLPPGGFLQAVAEAEAAMADFAVDAVRGARAVADLFCGSGAFTFRLAQGEPVRAADASEAAIQALRHAIGGAPGLKAITSEARDLFRRPLSIAELKGVDAVVFDPPRAGALEQARAIAASQAAVAVGVSCNAATFARDAAALIEGGFRLDRLLPVDQFLWSPHIEVVGVFAR